MRSTRLWICFSKPSASSIPSLRYSVSPWGDLRTLHGWSISDPAMPLRAAWHLPRTSQIRDARSSSGVAVGLRFVLQMVLTSFPFSAVYVDSHQPECLADRPDDRNLASPGRVELDLATLESSPQRLDLDQIRARHSVRTDAPHD